MSAQWEEAQMHSQTLAIIGQAMESCLSSDIFNMIARACHVVPAHWCCVCMGIAGTTHLLRCMKGDVIQYSLQDGVKASGANVVHTGVDLQQCMHLGKQGQACLMTIPACLLDSAQHKALQEAQTKGPTAEVPWWEGRHAAEHGHQKMSSGHKMTHA